MNYTTIQPRNYKYRTPIQSQYRRVRRRRPKKNNGFFKYFLLFTLVLGGIWYILNSDFKFGFKFPSEKKPINTLDFNFNFSPRRQNILLMGVDESENPSTPFKGTRSDTMLIVSIAPYGKNIHVISIPRDSKVYISGKNKPDKINHAFAFGGAKLTVKTVEEVFGIKINNYIAISNSGVIKLIDTLGGLPIYIEKNMKYDDYSGKLHINLKQGEHILSGKETEGYLRFRHDSYGDIGRIRRQQWFFNALIARLKDPTAIVKLPEILRIMPDYIQTDLSGYELAKYLGVAKNIDSSTVQIATIPGAPSTKGIISYWIIDPIKTQELIDTMIYRNKTNILNSDVSVGIVYSQKMAESANSIKENLENQGMQVKTQVNDSLSKDYIALHNLKVTGDYINDLKKIIPSIKDKHTIYDPVGINRLGRDITIILSGK